MPRSPDDATARSLYEQYRDALRSGHEASLAQRYADAISAYRTAAGLVPERVVPWLGMARSEAARGHLAAAIDAFEVVLSIDPGDAEARAGRADVLAALAARAASSPGHDVVDDPPELRTLVDTWDRALDRDDAAAMLDVAVSLARVGRMDAAIVAARDALSAAPRDPRAYRVLAWLDRRRGRPSGAEQTAGLLRRYLVVDDDLEVLDVRLDEALGAHDTAAILAVAEAHRQRQRPRTALDVAFLALRDAPMDVDVHLTISRARLDLGLRRPVLQDLDRLARLQGLADDEDGHRRVEDFVRRDLQRPPAASELL